MAVKITSSLIGVMLAVVGISLTALFLRGPCNCDYELSLDTEVIEILPTVTQRIDIHLLDGHWTTVRLEPGHPVSFAQTSDELVIYSENLPINSSCNGLHSRAFCLRVGSFRSGRLEGMITVRSVDQSSAAMLQSGKVRVRRQGRAIVEERDLAEGDGLFTETRGYGHVATNSAGRLNVIWKFVGRGVHLWRGSTGAGHTYRVRRYTLYRDIITPVVVTVLAAMAVAGGGYVYTRAITSLRPHRGHDENI